MRGALAASLPLLVFGLVACEQKTQVGSNCPEAGCPKPVSCNQASQQLPEGCTADDAGTRICNGAMFGDDRSACEKCKATDVLLQVDPTPIATCACAHCAAQVAACFDSASTEPDGDVDRDSACRAIVECGWAFQCAGSDCYCGEGVGRQTCLEEANTHLPKGACADLITRLSHCGTSDKPGYCVLNQQQTAGSLLARATAVAVCVTGDPLLPEHPDRPPMCPLSKFYDP